MLGIFPQFYAIVRLCSGGRATSLFIQVLAAVNFFRNPFMWGSSRWVPSVVYSVHVDSARYTAVAIAQSSNGSFLNYNDYCSGCSDKRRCEEFRVLHQLAQTKLEARSVWRHLAYSASPRWRALYSYVAAQFESAAHHNLILSQSLEPERNQFSVEVSAQHIFFWAFLFVS